MLLEQQQDSNPDLCYAVAVLHPLSYQASQGVGFETRLGLKNSGISFAIAQVHKITAKIINIEIVAICSSNEISSIKTKKRKLKNTNIFASEVRGVCAGRTMIILNGED